jgi:hypothetical protein
MSMEILTKRRARNVPQQRVKALRTVGPEANIGDDRDVPLDRPSTDELPDAPRATEQFVLPTTPPIGSPLAFEVKGRRLNTVVTQTSDRPESASVFEQWLRTKGKRPDFAYTDLRTVMEQILRQSPEMTTQEIDAAVAAGVQNFDPSASTLKVQPGLNHDLQLLAQHLLRYQVFHRGELAVTDANRPQNEYRRLELEKSKLLLSTAPSRNLNKLVPPTPALTGERPLQSAMPALLDINRPLAQSVFGQETYKAVFLLVNKLYFDAQQRGQADQRWKPETTDDEIAIVKQRSFFNDAFFDLLPKMENSTVPAHRSRAYVENQLRFHYDSEAETFDEASSDEGASSESELSSDEEINNLSENIFSSGKKRTTLLNSLGVFAKMSS